MTSAASRQWGVGRAPVAGPGRRLWGGALLQDVGPPGLLGRCGVPAAPGPVIMVVVLALALLEGAVAAPRPGELVGEVRHRRHCRTTLDPPPSYLPPSYLPSSFDRASAPALAIWPSCCAVTPLTPMAPTSLPSTTSGSPPSSGIEWGSAMMALRPPATKSSKTFVGRL